LSRFVVSRLLGMAIVLVAMTFIIFLLRQVVPSNPARAAVGPNAPDSVVVAKEKELGLDDPLLTQFGAYVRQLGTGDLGMSLTTLNPVRTDIRRNLPASAELLAAAALLAIVLAVALSLAQTLLARSELFRQLMLGGASSPIFLTGLVLVYLLSFQLGWFPSDGRTGIVDAPSGPTNLVTIDGLLAGRPQVTLDALWHLMLPALTLALSMSLAIARTLRSSIIGVLRQDHVRTARSKGLTEFQVVRRHVLRNASTGAISMTGLQIGFLFANLVIVERIFSWPGLGLYLTQVLAREDLTATLGVALIFGIAFIVVSTLVDVALAVADPRVGLE
jgi:ABC-type dipeptide/oligopeptide/nickel transport system permease component